VTTGNNHDGAGAGDPRGRARAELVWYLRHAGALGRWPVLDEEWARRVERRRREGESGAARERPRRTHP
jgi:hypothetical protein